MTVFTKRELNQNTAHVLVVADAGADVIVTGRGTPRWSFAPARLRTEMIRTMRRHHHPLNGCTPVRDRVGLIDETPEVHAVAESSERHLKTLDSLHALHVATAPVAGASAVATHDVAMSAAAEHLGPGVADPVLAD